MVNGFSDHRCDLLRTAREVSRRACFDGALSESLLMAHVDFRATHCLHQALRNHVHYASRVRLVADFRAAGS